MKSPRYLYTAGYEGMTSEAFISRLKAEGVKTLVDVRELPLSRKAGFSKTALSKLLADRGIAYVHMPTLGCPKAVRDRYKVDGDWKRYTVSFMAHLATQRAALAELAKIGSVTTAALMCFEADYTRCHRTYVARAVSQAGALPVAHITARIVIPELARRAAA
ncbi:MAG: hypothetical protein JWQ90_4330 [Hydrocarboniphaga sp.]|uniref:DUF488 domain-containing protein n=1 Tax=Hydrocarboniphaga sp. TaxID=2033016 RepID=UPI0026330C3D|nr:DUF488 domain-containing protein [Hydrocarboniphaga sp.]MDB5971880.1 hypothetical protein [Hydrocarboniphaga sp.]